ncbi:MAG: hypothetical protein NTW25_12445 [Candidatus Kapabacteria bacterium]|nr:hypothetical protein [Candidatus Kapabacteria bacterium]
MNINEFYILNNKFSKIPISIVNDNISNEMALNLIFGNYYNITFPLTFNQISGTKYTDFLNPCFVSLQIVSDKFINILI